MIGRYCASYTQSEEESPGKRARVDCEGGDAETAANIAVEPVSDPLPPKPTSDPSDEDLIRMYTAALQDLPEPPPINDDDDIYWHFSLYGLKATRRLRRHLTSPSRGASHDDAVEILSRGVASPTSPHFVRQLCFICSFCSLRFCKLSDKCRHMAVCQHDPTVVPHPVCGTCDVHFESDEALSAHERTHYEFNCPHCQFNATTIYRMRQHLKIHKERPYRCGVCGSEFATYNSRLVHVRYQHRTPRINDPQPSQDDDVTNPGSVSEGLLSSPEAEFESVTGMSRSGRKRFLPAKFC
jgi:hypothetical protein